jgi:hypothetical protein
MISENIRNFFLIVSINFLSVPVFANGSVLAASNILPYDLIISEIMADPDPPVALPNCEYIELYNRGSNAVTLTGCKLLMGSHSIVLGQAVVNPGAYLIVCDTDVAGMLNCYGQVLAVDQMPALVNTGQSLELKSPSNELIFSVVYSPQWYRDQSKSKGGWSLEIIDPENPCGGKENWCAARNTEGGTPGSRNSASDINRDEIAPVLLRATLPTDSSVILYFNEPMLQQPAYEEGNYSTNHAVFHPALAWGIGPDYKRVLLHYHATFKSQEIYTLTVLNALQDCVGNRIPDNSFVDFAICEPADTAEVVINEVLFNSGRYGEFVELFNRSDHSLELSTLTLSLADASTGKIKKMLHFTDNPFIILPHEYAAITSDADKITREGITDNRKSIAEVASFPALPDDAGVLIISDSLNRVVDRFCYRENLHDEMLRETDGISLERRDPEVSSEDILNWRSASTASGYCTPGLRNSQSVAPSDHCTINLSSPYISPDHDGINDELIIHLLGGGREWSGSIAVYDIKGMLIKTLVENAILGTDEFFTWLGDTNNGTQAPIGIYLIFGQFYDDHGTCKKIKKVVSLILK